MIEFDSVSFTHQTGTNALDDINLRIKSGEIVAVVGENGAGKTTLIKHINGLLKPTLGRVVVFGTDTKKASIAQLSRRVGIVFQNPDHQLFSESVEDEVAFGLRNFHLGEEDISAKVTSALNDFGLIQYRHTSPMMLSGGEKKRLCVAMIRAWDPDILILDEPTVGQDMIQKDRLSKIVRDMHEQGKTVILVSHDVEFLWSIRPRIIVMTNGRILEDGSSDSVFNNLDVLRKSNVVTPQLVYLSKSLGIKPTQLFQNAEMACERLLPRVRGS